MSRDVYLFEIAHATEAQDLHGLRSDAEADPDLNAEEKQQIFTAVSERFASLNAPHAQNKPRWK